MKNTIQKYYSDKNITIVGRLKNDIQKNNDRALRYIEYAIKNLLDTKGIEQLLKEIAQVVKSGNEGERIYHNRIMQFHAIYFVHHSLKLRILEVDSKTNKVLSPNRKRNKSCDIKATNSIRDYYFEAKDASSEITTRREVKGVGEVYDPMLEEQTQKWVVWQTAEADRKGANYLICRLEVYSVDATQIEKEFYDKWVRNIFKIEKRISENTFIIALPIELSSNFEGIYIIKPFGYLKLQLRY